jgi:hypothetical protein
MHTLRYVLRNVYELHSNSKRRSLLTFLNIIFVFLPVKGKKGKDIPVTGGGGP